jgi:hypothetical protein
LSEGIKTLGHGIKVKSRVLIHLEVWLKLYKKKRAWEVVDVAGAVRVCVK